MLSDIPLNIKWKGDYLNQRQVPRSKKTKKEEATNSIPTQTIKFHYPLAIHVAGFPPIPIPIICFVIEQKFSLEMFPCRVGKSWDGMSVAAVAFQNVVG